MNTLEKKVIETVLDKLSGLNCVEEGHKESISWLESLLSNNIESRELVSSPSKTNDSESVDLFLKEFKLYPSKNRAPKEKELAYFKISSRNMYSNYEVYCFDKDFKPMRPKSFKYYLKLKWFKYKRNIRIDDQVTSGYEFVMNKDTRFDNSVFVKEITF